MKLTLGFSPCPNDTFMFDALVNKKIDTRGMEFEWFIDDVEQLNQKILEASLDISKISFATYPQIANDYIILTSGSALGKNNGPLIISKTKIYPDELKDVKMAVPGLHTTANLLLSIAYPEIQNKKAYLFSAIEEAILSNEVDAGVIIHETRFTYQKKGLCKILDLGEFWQEKTELPLALGGIVMKRELDTDIIQSVNSLIKSSIEWAMQNPQSVEKFIKNHATEMNDEVIARHINLYVNEYSLNIGDEGKKAILRLFEEGAKTGYYDKIETDIFVE